MKSLSKKIVGILLTVAMATTCVFAFTGCNNNKVKAVELNQITGLDDAYAFGVKKGNNETKELLNKFLNKESTKEAVEISLKYHDKKSDKHIEYPNLNDNTGVTYTMVTESGFPPFEYVEESEGIGIVDSVKGVDVDLMMLFCEENNAKLKVKALDDFKAIIPTIKNNDKTFIAAAGMSVTPERKSQIDFSVTYIGTVQCVLCPEGKGYKSLKDLNGKKIGVQSGTTGKTLLENAVNDKKIDTNIKTYNKYLSALEDLRNGKLDAIVVDDITGKNLKKNFKK